MFTIDVTKNQLSRAINDQQHNLNNSNTHRLRQHRSDFIAEKSNKPRVRNSTEHKVYIHKNLADIQKEQIELRKIDAANDLIKSRIQDEQNLLRVQEKFPYGKQNVDISEDVLERYKGNYIQQSRIIQKFRMQAQLMKKTSRVKGSQGKPFQWCYRQGVVDNRKKQQELKKMRQTLQQRLQQQRVMRRKQKENLRKITDTLSGLSLQLHNNSYTLEKGIRELHDRMKKNEKKLLDFPRRIHNYKDILDLQTSNSRIPIIVYKNEPFDARLYFSDVYKKTEKVKKQPQFEGNKQQYARIIKILNENNRRLHYLDKLSAYQREI